VVSASDKRRALVEPIPSPPAPGACHHPVGSAVSPAALAVMVCVVGEGCCSQAEGEGRGRGGAHRVRALPQRSTLSCRTKPHSHTSSALGMVRAVRPGGPTLPRIIAAEHLPGRFRPQFRDKNRRGIGKSQSKWTASKMETPGSQKQEARAPHIAGRARHVVVLQDEGADQAAPARDEGGAERLPLRHRRIQHRAVLLPPPARRHRAPLSCVQRARRDAGQ
jgi:hypothetical protein